MVACTTWGSSGERFEEESSKFVIPEVESAPSAEIKPYLVEPSAGVIFKARPGAWDRVGPLVERVLAAELGGESLPEGGTLQEMVGQMSGYDLQLDHVAADRPAYLILAPHRHGAAQGCLSVGLPCLLMGSPGPRYGRFLVPTDAPGDLADEFRAEIGEGDYRIVRHDHHVRVEFATSIGEEGADEVEEHLEVRARDRPMEVFVRRTPAREALLDEEAPVGVYVNLRSAIDAAMYLDQWRLYRRMDAWSAGERMQRVLGATAALGRLAELDAGKQAEVEDVSLVARGGEEGYTLDVVSTRTTRGRRLRSAAANKVSLPELEVEDPTAALEWSLRLDRITEQAGRAPWARPSPGGSRDVLQEIGGWGIIGLLRAPTAVAATLAEEVARRTGGLDVTRLIGGRLQIAAVDSAAERPAGLRGGAVMLLAEGAQSESVVRWFRGIERVTGAVDTEVSRRTDGTIELRVGLHRPVEAVVDVEGDAVPVQRLAIQASPGTAERAVGAMFGDDRTVSERSIARMVSAVTSEGGVTLDHAGTRQWYASRIGIGRLPGGKLAVKPTEFSVRQPRNDCFGQVASMTGDLIDRALERRDLDAYLEDQLSQEVGRFRNTIADCGAAGRGEQQLARGAIEYFNGWRALVGYRVGSDVWDARMARICKEGHQWACEPETGQWPWMRGRGGRVAGVN
jgi:hypothetical protein